LKLAPRQAELKVDGAALSASPRILSEAAEDRLQVPKVAEEARDHRLQELRGVQARQVEGVACAGCQQRHEGELRSPVTFAERMNCIQMGEEFRGFFGEGLSIQALEKPRRAAG
jgi:hypothetical protein